MLTFDQARTELADLLRRKSVFRGDFTLSSGARSNYYLDCRLTTLDPKGAWLVGQTKLIEGNFRKGDTVVVLDDVVTSGESTVAAINAVVKEGGTVAFVAVLVDRQEGGRERIEALGYRVVSLFVRSEEHTS